LSGTGVDHELAGLAVDLCYMEENVIPFDFEFEGLVALRLHQVLDRDVREVLVPQEFVPQLRPFPHILLAHLIQRGYHHILRLAGLQLEGDGYVRAADHSGEKLLSFSCGERPGIAGGSAAFRSRLWRFFRRVLSQDRGDRAQHGGECGE
jgi:hypothetical protein